MMYQVIRRLRRSLPKSLGCQRRGDCIAHVGNLFRIGRSKEREEQLKRQQLKGKEGIWGSLFAPCSVHTSLIPFSNLEPYVKSFRHLARKMKDGKEEFVGRTGLSWSFSYLLLKFQVLVPRVSTLVSLSFLSQSSDVFFFFVFTNSLLSKMQLLRRSSKCLMRVVCRCSLAERDGAVVAEPNRPLFQLSPAGAAAGRAGRDDGREAAAGGTL